MTEQWDGVPENPERDGWHWLHHKEDLRPIPAMWNAELAGWTCGPLYSPGGIVELGYTYLGPCLTPAEVAAREAARAEAMRSDASELADALGEHGVAVEILTLPLPHASALARALAAAEKRGMERAAKIVDRALPIYGLGGLTPEEAEEIGIHQEIARAIRNAAAQESEE